jgi:hypothetical protein
MAQGHLIEVIECSNPMKAVYARGDMWYHGIVTPPGPFSLAELRGGAPKRIDMCGTEARQNDCPEFVLETRLEGDGKGNATRFELPEQDKQATSRHRGARRYHKRIPLRA